MALLEGLADAGLVAGDVPEQVHTLLQSPDTLEPAYLAYARAIAGLPAVAVSATAGRVWAAQRRQLFPYVRSAINLLKSQDFTVVLLSGSPHEVVVHAGVDLGCDVFQGARFAVREGVYTGGVEASPWLPGAKHLPAVSRGRAHLLVLGNSANDAALLSAACSPVAFEPSTELILLAAEAGWPVVDRSSVLTVLLRETEVSHEGCQPCRPR